VHAGIEGGLAPDEDDPAVPGGDDAVRDGGHIGLGRAATRRRTGAGDDLPRAADDEVGGNGAYPSAAASSVRMSVLVGDPPTACA
jgi:hypothetical protein